MSVLVGIPERQQMKHYLPLRALHWELAAYYLFAHYAAQRGPVVEDVLEIRYKFRFPARA